MLLKKIVGLIIFAALVSCAFSQDNSKTDCSIMKDGVFKYLDIEDSTAYIVIKNSTHTEYHNNGKYFIKSRIKWTGDCTYDMMMTSITIPNFPFKPGNMMHVKITQIENNIIYYTSTVDGRSWDGKLKIIELAGRKI